MRRSGAFPASQQTELTERQPIHVVCAWLGNSIAIADEHYLQVTEDHYLDAAGKTIDKDPRGEAAQKAAQSAVETACHEWTVEPTRARKSPRLQELATAGTCGQGGWGRIDDQADDPY
jgi:hypothetical protein